MRKGASQAILLTTEKQKPPLAEMGGFAFCFPRMALIASAAKRTQTPQVNQPQGQACPEHGRRATARQRAQSSPAPAPHYQHTPRQRTTVPDLVMPALLLGLNENSEPRNRGKLTS